MLLTSSNLTPYHSGVNSTINDNEANKTSKHGTFGKKSKAGSLSSQVLNHVGA